MFPHYLAAFLWRNLKTKLLLVSMKSLTTVIVKILPVTLFGKIVPKAGYEWTVEKIDQW
jgi:hypothetical protein